jgi:poly(A) polymerase
VVGGAVRNALLDIPPGDIDLATTALPDEVVRRARAAGIKCVPTGIDHGTVTLVIDGHPFEVTTLREDTETFGRKAKVAFGRDWIRDAERRDFTINGLSVDAEGIVHDHVGGLADIAARRVRFIGDPASASPRITCASCVSSDACSLWDGRNPIAPDILPASPGARDWPAFPPNACAWKC